MAHKEETEKAVGVLKNLPELKKADRLEVGFRFLSYSPDDVEKIL